MKRTRLKPRNIHDLRLIKSQLEYEVKLQEEVFGNGLLKMRDSFFDSLRMSARLYAERLAAQVIVQFIRSRFK